MINVLKIVFFVSLNSLIVTAEENDIFVLGNNVCITNGSSAIIFNTDDTYTQESTIVPEPPISNFNCNFDSKPCNREWYIYDEWIQGHSFNVKQPEIITDRRWEAFKTLSTKEIKKGKKLDILQVLDNLHDDISIPFSVKVEQEAHIFLCDGSGDEPKTSNCYWIMLGSDSGTTSAVRRCESGFIPDEIRMYPKEPCKTRADNSNGNPFRKRAWNHFVIQKFQNSLKVFKSDQLLLNITDDKYFEPKQMFIHSKKGIGLWKIHSYSFLESKSASGFRQLGPTVKPTDTILCISMFLKTAAGSKLAIRVIPDDNIGHMIRQEYITNGKWQEVQIFSDNFDNYKGYFVNFITTSDADDKKTGYWAIDQVRECHHTEYRYIRAEGDELSCQKIDDSITLNVNKRTEVTKKGMNCSEDSFGEECIPCSIFGSKNCPGFKYCQLYTDGQKCYCTAGYTNSGCTEDCPNESYGHGCSKISHCQGPHNLITGSCYPYQCIDPYSGPSCQVVLSPFFKSQPSVYNVESRRFTIIQQTLTTEGGGDFYYFQYSETNKNKWARVSSNIPIAQSQPVVILDIGNGIMVNPDTDYEVRAIVEIEGEGIKSYADESFRKKFNFTTPCTQLTPSDIIITPTNMSAMVSIKLPSDGCQLKNYYYSLNGKKYEHIEEDFVLQNLEVDKKYSLTITHVSTYYGDFQTIKTFTTEEGVPSAVQNLNSIITEDNQILLSWDEPEEKNGIITNYEILYKVLKGVACSNNEIDLDPKSELTTETSYTLKDLKPYSRYGIIVRAHTKAGAGNLTKNVIETNPSDLTNAEEIILDDQYTALKDGLILTHKPLKCLDLSGPIQIKLETVCESEWCHGQSAVYERDYNENNILKISDGLQPLQPFTNYSVTASVRRNDASSWMYPNSKMYMTAADIPSAVTELKSYTKTMSSISLRWKPPYPPTGTLSDYMVVYHYGSSGTINNPYKQPIKPTPCSLWKEFHCATITRGVSRGYTYYTYYIQVQAKYSELSAFGRTSNTIVVIIQEEGPEAPYGFDYSWTNDNELSVSWYHPNNTNGKLESFDMRVSDSNDRIPFKVSTYQLQYKFKITRRFNFCTNYTFVVRAHNSYSNSNDLIRVISTPPSLPPTIQPMHFNNTNSTISSEIVPDSYNIDTLYILISDYDKIEDLDSFQDSLNEHQQPNLTTSRIVYRATGVSSAISFDIGNNVSYNGMPNPPLESGKNYCISVFLVNECNGLTRFKRFQQYVATDVDPTLIDDSSTASPLPLNPDGMDGLWALILLLLIPLCIFGVWYMRKKHPNIDKFIKSQPKAQMDDQIVLTDRPPQNKQKVHILKPKPSMILPALTTKHSKKIRIIEFENYVKESVESGELERQHNLFAKGLLKPHDVGSSADNKNKNRYKNLIAYDHTRVKLKRTAGDESNYINASYIDGYRKPKTYIATQGPKVNTLNDFWSMIWQTNVRDIVMLANIYENGKKKVEKYWPDINEDKQYGDIRVQYISSSVYANFDERMFNVHHNNEDRKITQLHFTTWPDHGVPLYSQSLVPFLQKMLKIPYNPQSPILVHCSAGVGRTGTIILSDICLRMAAGEGFIDFLAHLENLRTQRANMVDNIEQYKLAHLVVLECLFGMRTAIPCTDDMSTIVESTISNNGIKTQMKYILETQWQDSAMETMLDNEEVAPIYHEKNRFKEIVPDHYRVYITRYPHDDETSSYINAVLVDEFRNPGRYIVTQQPLPNTLGDFWRLVLERSCTVIISLNNINLEDQTVCQMWPEKGEELNPVDFLTLVHKKTQRLDFYKIITVELSAKQTGVDSMVVTIVALDNWRAEDLLPNSIEEFLSFRDAADALSRTSENVIITCYDGAKASGLYLAMSFLIEEMKLEQECDVCLAVRSIRHSRKQFVTTEEQYEFLYRASLMFITGFQSYSNFA